ncbi:ABC transporter A, ABCA [Kipferlia bialata]|uniref:ABC transporter A, ABCA n=1 Tax=Kipferlia bialata TaxID=797122 RepID=A0A9K3CZ12_9EUKA|nr:ABC transporter A, ABCA [Kipferlia bialata]|eukprot:g6598.t1
MGKFQNQLAGLIRAQQKLLMRNKGILMCQFLFPVALFLFTTFLAYIAQVILSVAGHSSHEVTGAITTHLSVTNGWVGGVELVFEGDGDDQSQWGVANGLLAEYDGMFRNLIMYYLHEKSHGNPCIKNDSGHCIHFPLMDPVPQPDAYTLDDYLYTQLETVNAEYTEQEMLIEKAYLLEMPNVAYIVHENSDMFQYDKSHKTYTHSPDTLIANYTMQIATNIPMITDFNVLMDMQGETMLLVFEGVVQDLIVSKNPAHYSTRVNVMPQTHMYTSTYPVTVSTDMLISDLTFPLLAFTFSFVFVIHTTGIIQEKEDHLKQNMLLAGLRFSAYYTGWLIACTATSLLVFGFCYVFGWVTAQPAYTQSGLLVWMLLCASWAIAVSGVASFYASFFTQTKMATFTGIILLLFQAPIYQYTELLVGLPPITNIWPFFMFFQLLGMLTPMGPIDERVLTSDLLMPSARGVQFMGGCAVLVIQGIAYTLLGGYLDNVLPSAGDSRLHPLFFLAWLVPKTSSQEGDGAADGDLGYTTSSRHVLSSAGATGSVSNPIKRSRGNLYSLMDSCGTGESDRIIPYDTALFSKLVSPEPYEDGEDINVTKERQRVSQMLRRGGQMPPLVVADLRKVFKGRGKQKANVAVHRTTLGVDRGTCFGLLGENGAGKSTTINLICGTLKPTSGTVFIKGGDVCALDKASLLEHLGVCPQHDRLHGELTVREEVEFYMRLRGYSHAQSVLDATKVIESVGLASKADQRIAGLSGGMQRRTSLCIALTGTPSVVLLDEPTSGLDPATRRELWAIIPRIKQTRAVVLTTHSMDEAEILCDSLSIVASGRLQCLGSPSSLSYEHGKAYVLNFLHHNASLSDRDTAEQLVRYLRRSLSPDTFIKNSYGASTCILVPRRELSAKVVVEVVETSARRLAIQEWSLSDYSLQDVFVDLILKARLKYDGANAHSMANARDIFGRPL